MRAKINILLCIILLTFIALSIGCTNENTGSEQQADIEYLLKNQIDKNADDYLASTNDIDYLDILYLDCIHYGSFTAENKNELMAIFKIIGTPHAGGLDQTIAAIYETDSRKIITQKTFAADAVSLYILRDFYRTLFSLPTSTENLLFIGSTTGHGNTCYAAELYSLSSGTWTEKPLPIGNDEGDLTFAVTDNAVLHVFRTGNSEISSFFWDGLKKEFVKDLT